MHRKLSLLDVPTLLEAAERRLAFGKLTHSRLCPTVAAEWLLLHAGSADAAVSIGRLLQHAFGLLLDEPSRRALALNGPFFAPLCASPPLAAAGSQVGQAIREGQRPTGMRRVTNYDTVAALINMTYYYTQGAGMVQRQGGRVAPCAEGLRAMPSPFLVRDVHTRNLAAAPVAGYICISLVTGLGGGRCMQVKVALAAGLPATVASLVSLFSPERDTDNFRVDLERTLQLPDNAGNHVCMRTASEAMMSTDTTHAATPATCLPCVLCAIRGGT
jgi:hypothetical protein